LFLTDITLSAIHLARIAFMYQHINAYDVYYCPKCDRSVSRERLVEIDAELRERFGRCCLPSLICPVCETEFIDLEKVESGGDRHVRDAKRKEAEHR